MNALAVVPEFGYPYGDRPHMDLDGRRVYLYRRGQKCRWFDARGVQIGPEHANVAPALAWAYANDFRDRELDAALGI